MSLKDCIKRDIDKVFLNVNDFCDEYTLQIKNERFLITGSLQSNTVQNNSGNSSPLQTNSWTLYIKYPIKINKYLSSGDRVTLDNHSYSVVSISDELGICTVQLQTSMGR